MSAGPLDLRWSGTAGGSRGSSSTFVQTAPGWLVEHEADGVIDACTDFKARSAGNHNADSIARWKE